MSWLMEIIEKILTIYDIYVFMLLLLIGLILIRVDGPRMKKNKMEKESKIAKIMGYGYLALGILIYAATVIM